MSQFNYPRINFVGKCVMDTATANNGWYLPLVFFDPTRVEILVPPRVYLQDIYLPEGVALDDIRKIVPAGTVKKDDTTLFRGSWYVEIQSIHSDSIFKEWARTPLGEFAGDVEYHELYKTVIAPVNKGPLTGSIPGYWNYYGTMEYSFRDVRITSVATGVDQGKEVFADERTAPELAKLVGCEINLNKVPGDNSTTSARMVDCLPTMAMYTQIFCDRLNIIRGDEVLLSGKPMKASLRWLNPFRVVNENMPYGGSGAFVTSLPTEDVDGGEGNPVMQLFAKHADDDRKLKGVFFYQAISEIEENREIDYRRDGSIRNPAYGTVAGRICPWYEGDMISFSLGRQLIGDKPFIVGKNKLYDAPVSLLTPTPFRHLSEKNVLQFDFLNSFPLRLREFGDGPFSPDPREENEYEAYDLGEIILKLEPENACDTGDGVELGRWCFGEHERSRKELYNSGGMYHVPIPEDVLKHADRLKEWNVAVYGEVYGSVTRIMIESPIVIMSDQAGLYADQGDDPTNGYRSYKTEKDHCILSVQRRGTAVTEPIEMTIIEYKMSSSGALRTDRLYRIADYKDGDIVSFDTSEDKNAIYSFLPYRTHSLPPHGYPAAIVQTGFFVNLKVLPFHDYGPYLDPTHPAYPSPVSFDILYDRIFRKYNLMTPTMNFHKERFENPWAARELERRMDPENWSAAWYMPVTRDLSKDQFKLLQKWAQQWKDEEKQELKREAASSDETHALHLNEKAFFNK